MNHLHYSTLVFLLIFNSGFLFADEQEQVRQTYLKYQEAILQGNLTALKSLVPEERMKELEPDPQSKLMMIQALRPANVQISQIEITTTNATINLTGKSEMGSVTGTAAAVRQKDSWKILSESWKISVDLSGSADLSESVIPEAKDVLLKNPASLPKPHVIFKLPNIEPSALIFTKDGKYLITTGYGDFYLRVLDLRSGKQTSSIKMDYRPQNLVMTADSKGFFTSDAYLHITYWPFENGKVGTPKTLIEKAGNYLTLSPDGKLLVTTQYLQNPVVIWNAATGAEIQKLKDTNKMRKCAFSPDGKLLAGTIGNVIHIWDTSSWAAKTYTIPKVDPNGDLGGIHFSPDGKWLGLGFIDSSIVTFDVQKRKVVHNFYVSNATTWDIKFHPHSQFFATSQHNSIIYLWDTKTGSDIGKLRYHKGAPQQIAFSPDGKTLASVAEDREIVLWRDGNIQEPLIITGSEAPTVETSPTITPSVTVKEVIQEKPAPPTPSVKLTPELFQVDGVIGSTVTLNGNILVEEGNTFQFTHQNQTFSLKLLKIADDHVKIQYGEEILSIKLP